MPWSYSYLQVNFNKRFDGAVRITVVLKDFENKVKSLSPRLRVRAPVKPFFIFYFFAFAKKQECFAIYVFAEKNHVLMYYAHVKRLHSVKWRGLHRRKEVWNETVTESCMG